MKKRDIEKQDKLFNIETSAENEWQNMPEFEHEDLTPYQSIIVHFANLEDKNKFKKLVNQTITENTKSIWYPEAEITKYMDKRYVDEP